MSKVLFVSHHRNGNTGWSRVAQDYILAIDNAGLDIVVRPLLLNEPDTNIPNRIKELEQKSSSGCDTIINCILPHHLEYSSKFKNISIFFSECDQIPLEWTSRLNLMDEVWVCNSQMKQACIRSGVTANLEIVLPPADTEKYQRTYPKLPGLAQQLSGDFAFYFIGDLNKRKNLSGVLKAFHAEFDSNEPVQLVVKSSKFGVHPQEVAQNIQKLSDEVKIGLKKYPSPSGYKRELVITDKMSDTDILSLHTTCIV